MMARKIYSYLRLIRPVNCFMMGLAVYIGLAVALGRFPGLELLKLILLSSTTGFSLCGAAMAINDYYDFPVDRVNAPDRPLPSGLISPREAIGLTVFLALLGLASATVISPVCLMYASLFFGLAYLYSWKLKKTGLLGNLSVSFCVAAPFMYGGLAGLTWIKKLNFESILPLTLFSTMAFLANTGREVVKGLADVEGDKAYGVMTVAVKRGLRYAARLASSFQLTAVSLSLITPILSEIAYLYYPPILLADFGFLYSSIKLILDPSKTTALKVKNQILIWMLLGLIGFLAGRTV